MKTCMLRAADCCYVIEDDDHVTSVTSFPIDGGSDFLLLYGTVSGCVFGMSVNHRSKVFSIPCPHVDVSASAAVDAVTFLPSGQLLVAYRGWTGFTVMNFGVADPPNRPPTRCLKRDKWSHWQCSNVHFFSPDSNNSFSIFSQTNTCSVA